MTSSTRSIPATTSTTTNKRPWYWIPSLYFTEGLPYFAVVVLSTIMYQRLGLSNTESAFYTAWFYLPWVIKPFWSPFVALYQSRRRWIIAMQFILAIGLAGVALSLPLDNYLQYTIVFFWLLAFSSATHDIAADGYYIETLDDGQQAYFVGIRSTFYRLAMITGQGLIVILAGKLEKIYDVQQAWLMTMLLLSLMMLVVAFYHSWVLPKSEHVHVVGRVDSVDATSRKHVIKDYFSVLGAFFRKKHVGIFIAFILLYRLGEAQLTKIASLFMLDERVDGGLGLSTESVGFIYGTVGVLALVIGGILGGILVSRKGLKYWIWWMALAINLPDVVYVYMAWQQPQASSWLIYLLVAIEQFGYGFGFTAFMMYLIYIADGEFKTAHYAIATGFMAAGMMIPGMFSGLIQEYLGYSRFFMWVMLATLPAFYIISRLPLEAGFGKANQLP
ncbi:MAG TPA: MFS transporter [Thiothrix sp.]|nr:MFS transporter [Thiothrix sp.]